MGSISVQVTSRPSRGEGDGDAEDLLRPRQADQPEKRLVRAVLLQGILDAYMASRLGVAERELSEVLRRKMRGARAWINSSDEEVLDGHYTFAYCCHMIGVDPDWLRSALAREEENGTCRLFRYSTGAFG